MKKRTVDIISALIWGLVFITFTFNNSIESNFIKILIVFALGLSVIVLNIIGINTKFTETEKVKRTKDLKFLGFIMITLLILWLLKTM